MTLIERCQLFELPLFQNRGTGSPKQASRAQRCLFKTSDSFNNINKLSSLYLCT